MSVHYSCDAGGCKSVTEDFVSPWSELTIRTGNHTMVAHACGEACLRIICTALAVHRTAELTGMTVDRGHGPEAVNIAEKKS